MVVRRTDAQPAPVKSKPVTVAKPAAKNVAVAKPVVSRTQATLAQAKAQRPAISDFHAAKAKPVALDANVKPPFVRPAQGEWTLDDKGRNADPVTFYIHGNLSDVNHALEASGWTKADPRGLTANLKYAGSAVKQEAYKALAWGAKQINGATVGLAGVFGIHPHKLLPDTPKYVPGVDRMPVSTQTLRGQKLIEAYEQHNDPLGGRDHLRVFDTGELDAAGKHVYAIAASRDSGLRFAPDHPESGFMFHTVESNVASERENVLRSLQQGGHVTNLQPFQTSYSGKSVYGEYDGDSKGYDLSLG